LFPLLLAVLGERPLGAKEAEAEPLSVQEVARDGDAGRVMADEVTARRECGMRRSGDHENHTQHTSVGSDPSILRAHSSKHGPKQYVTTRMHYCSTGRES
jgi:hypothetical protein